MRARTMQEKKHRAQRRLSAIAIALQFAGAGLVPAYAQQPPPGGGAVALSQPAQPLGAALNALAARTGLLVGVDAELVRGRQAPALEGSFTPVEALRRLLAGSGLEAVPGAGGSYTLRPLSAAVPGPAAQADAATLGTLGVVQVTSQRDTVTEGSGSYTTNGMVSSATRLDLTLRETPQSISIITRDRMDDQGLAQVSDVLRQAPGLTFIQSGDAGTDSNAVYARGFAVENYQIDGIAQTGSWLTQTGDLAPYDRVEIVRGATGLLNGVGTPAATINLVRKRPTAQFQGTASLSAGSWNQVRSEVDIGGPLNAAGTVRGRIVAAAQKGNSWIDRYEGKKHIFYGIVEADLSRDTRLTAGVELQQHDNDGTARSGLPLFFSDGSLARWDRSASAAASWAYSHQRQRMVFASLDHRLGNGWKTHVSFNRSERSYDDVIGYAARGYVNRLTGAGLSLWPNQWNSQPVQNAIDAYVSGPFTLFGRQHEAVFGVSASRTTELAPGYTNWTIPGYNASIPNYYLWNGDYPAAPYNPQISETRKATAQSGAYATVRLKPTDRLSLIGGVRVSDWKDESRRWTYATGALATSLRTENGVVTPYTGVVYDFADQWSAYASYTSIFKPQTNKTTSGDYLDPLEGDAYEAGVKGALLNERLNVSAAVFEIRQDNLAVALTNQFAPDGSPAYRAAQGTRTRGYEFEVAGEVRTGLQVGASFTHAVARDADGARLNTNVPKNTLKLFTSYLIPGIGQGLTVGGGFNWQSAIYTDKVGPSAVRFTQPSYATLDLMANLRINRQLSVSFALNNVFDKRYYTSTSASYYGAPRNARVTLKATF
ncbi:MAG: TonB-dependent siderophore receptor [Pseudomonadota bacterium]|nr:TonB-dependent siderophore receptor [Pseudomonadota bacterium]